jgi:hypothetical protein
VIEEMKSETKGYLEMAVLTVFGNTAAYAIILYLLRAI